MEIAASNGGKLKKAIAKNDKLTPEQKDILNNVDAATDISVVVNYIPNNTLKNNDPKVFDFTFTVDPENKATYPGGQQQLNQYLKEKRHC